MPDPAIVLNDVHLTLGSAAGPVNILRGINLNISHGERVSIVGPSGSGKSSLLMVVAGLEAVTSGKVVAAGEDITNLNEDALARFRLGKVGIIFQSFHLIPTMNALENVAVPLEISGDNRAFETAREILSRVGLSHRLTHYPSQLSGGEQQRVALARAVVGKPVLLLADEPTGNLDGETGSEITELLFSLNREMETTLVLVSHDTDLANQCDRILTLEDGRIIDE